MVETDAASEWFPTAKTKVGEFEAALLRVTPGTGKGYDGNVERPTLTFTFEITGGEIISRTFTAKNSPKSGLLKFVAEMTGQASTAIPTAPAELKAFIEALVSQVFRIRIEPSQDTRYLNIVGARPVA